MRSAMSSAPLPRDPRQDCVAKGVSFVYTHEDEVHCLTRNGVRGRANEQFGGFFRTELETDLVHMKFFSMSSV